MKNISEIYSEYKIMPTLQQHQLRVAAVAKTIADSLKVDTENVIATCLLHDMGNIIKFDLSYFPDFLQPEGLEYWQEVKDEFIQKYGADEHVATEKICHELGLSEKQTEYLEGIGFTRAKRTLETGSLEQKICCYADQRVGPHGLLTIEERLIDGRKRYANRKDKDIAADRFEELAIALREIEKEIFSHSSLQPTDLKKEVIEEMSDKLREFSFD